MTAWEIERGPDGMPARMHYPGHVARAVGARMGPHIVTKTGWLMAHDARALLWRIACAERRGRAFAADSDDALDALEHAGLVYRTGLSAYRLTDAGQREIPGSRGAERSAEDDSNSGGRYREKGAEG